MMNWEDLAKKLIEYLDNTKDFVLDQAPIFFQEVVNFGRVYYTASCSIAISLIFIAIICGWKSFKKIKAAPGNSYNTLEEGSVKYVIASCICGLCGFISTIIFFDSITLCLMSWTAPRLFVIKYLLGV